MTHVAPDPMEELVDQFVRKYRLVAGKVGPIQGEGGGRRPQPASRPPLQLDPVSEMYSAEQSLRYHINQFNRILHRVKRIDIPALCPHCEVGKLVGWVRDYDPNDPDRPLHEGDEVVCLNWQADEHATEGWPSRWTADEWKRLGVRAGVREDKRFGPRLPGAASG